MFVMEEKEENVKAFLYLEGLTIIFLLSWQQPRYHCFIVTVSSQMQDEIAIVTQLASSSLERLSREIDLFWTNLRYDDYLAVYV